jgi:RHS repeat-associated protein
LSRQIGTTPPTDLRIVRDTKVLTLHKSKKKAYSNPDYYYYTLQGWLKGVNNPNGDKDAQAGTSTNHFALDEVQYQLGYYKGDYKPISGTMFDIMNQNPLNWYNDGTSNHGKGLYNGNISTVACNIRQFLTSNTPQGAPTYTGAWTLNYYQYDQLNRIVEANSYKDYEPLNGNPFGNINATTDKTYHTDYAFDANRNITQLNRSAWHNGALAGMDAFTYHYNKNATNNKLTDNRLNYVSDGVTASPFTGDIKQGQTTANYKYSQIGQLTADEQEHIDNIEWDAYGRMRIVHFDANTKPDIEYQYNAMGARTLKIVKGSTSGTSTNPDTWTYTTYITDATGNLLYTETKTPNTTVANEENWDYRGEYGLYGASRIGVYTETWSTIATVATDYGEYERHVGRRTFELTNQVGSVLATLSDYKTYNVTLSHYEAVVLTATEYGVYGEVLEHREYAFTKSYTRGFNGALKEDELLGEFNAYDLGARMYSARLGRQLSTDPREAEYAWQSTYAYFSNSPISQIDFMGMGGTGDEECCPEDVCEETWEAPDLSYVTVPCSASEYRFFEDRVYHLRDTYRNIETLQAGQLWSFKLDGIEYVAVFKNEDGTPFVGYQAQDGSGKLYNEFDAVNNNYDPTSRDVGLKYHYIFKEGYYEKPGLATFNSQVGFLNFSTLNSGLNVNEHYSGFRYGVSSSAIEGNGGFLIGGKFLGLGASAEADVLKSEAMLDAGLHWGNEGLYGYTMNFNAEATLVAFKVGPQINVLGFGIKALAGGETGFGAGGDMGIYYDQNKELFFAGGSAHKAKIIGLNVEFQFTFDLGYWRDLFKKLK